MPRRQRFLPVGVPAHVTNRGNDRRCVFLQAEDYQYFVDLLRSGLRRFAVDVFGYILMPTHFHLVISQREHGAVSAYLRWVTSISACNYRSETSSTGQGHVFQRRFWSEAVRDARHFLAVLRYVEANALRAALVERAEDWQWSSLWERLRGDRKMLTPVPVPLPAEWLDLVNRPFDPQTLERIRRPTPRGRPRTRRKVGESSGRMALPTGESAPAQHD